eukprot:342598_1
MVKSSDCRHLSLFNPFHGFGYTHFISFIVMSFCISCHSIQTSPSMAAIPPLIQQEPHRSFLIHSLMDLHEGASLEEEKEINDAIHHVKYGWDLGINESPDKPWNQKTFAMNYYTFKEKIAIGINLLWLH